MASSKEYLNFVLEQCNGLTARAMMGEYVLYYGGKVVGGIYDNRLLVKPTFCGCIDARSTARTPIRRCKRNAPCRGH